VTRVWYQSFTDEAHHGAYLGRLQRHLDALAAPGVKYTVAGMTPADLAVHRISELRCAVQCVDAALRAEDEGYDVFVVGHFQDSGLDEARAAVGIPVVGMGEASMLHALTLGRRFGLVTIDDLFVDLHRAQAQRLSLADRLVGVASISVPPAQLLSTFDAADGYGELRRAFEVAAAPLVEAGAEVVVPAGGLFALLSAHERDFQVGGAVVLNPIAVALRSAETAAWLRATHGTSTSRAGAYALPPAAAVEELRRMARGE
jgi:Asp/Glu/hydantoin racemase